MAKEGLGKMLSAGGKGLLDGAANMGGLPGNNLLGGALTGGGQLGGISLMEMLFDKLGIFGKKKQEEETPNYAPSGVVGPRY